MNHFEKRQAEMRARLAQQARIARWARNIIIFLCLFAFTGWGTHIVSCFNTENWGFLIAGAILAPIGVFHGWWIMFTSFFALF